MSGYEGCIRNIRIAGIASAVPKRVLNNEVLVERIGGRRNKRKIMLTGVKMRHICAEGQSASDFATFAAEKLLTALGWERDEIKILIFVTQQPDLMRPSTAMLIQRRLKIGQNCTCFDINMGCSGFTVGLQVIASMMGSVGGKALLLVGDGRYLSDDEIQSDPDLLFGDGGAAAALEMSAGYEMLFNQKTDGYRFDTIMCKKNGFAQMDGNGVLLFSLNEVSQNIRQFCENNHLTANKIDYYVFHQAQELILQGIANECNLAWDKILNSYEMYGNTSSVSIPISICANEKILKEQSQVKILMSGFGIGLSWGIVYVNIDTTHILPIFETDYNYSDKLEFNL